MLRDGVLDDLEERFGGLRCADLEFREELRKERRESLVGSRDFRVRGNVDEDALFGLDEDL